MKKISHIWSIICTNSMTDQKTNNISLFNLVEKYSIVISKEEAKNIKDKKKLIIPFNQEVVSRFIKNVKNTSVIFDMKIDIITPSERVIENKEFKTINFDKKFNNMRISNKISNIPVEESGLYNFIVKIKEVGETKFIKVGIIPIEIDIKFEK